MRRRRPAYRNPIPAPAVKLQTYVDYVGTILSPKSKIPCAVYVGKGNHDAFYLFSPDRKHAYGAGYYGEEGPEECTRQHMLPGLVDKSDVGKGLGIALYLAGNMVITASYQDANGEFPWTGGDAECTYSEEGDRSSSASRAWANLVRHDLAEREPGESEYVQDEFDVDDFVSEDQIQDYYDEPVEIETISGTITVEGYKNREVEIMRWDIVKDSGLVMHLGPFFDEPLDREEIPPEVFAKADWRYTPLKAFLAYAQQNAEVAAGGSFGAGNTLSAYDIRLGKEWIREAACHMRPGSPHEVELLNLIGEGPQQFLPGMKPKARVANRRQINPSRVCPTTYLRKSQAWDRKWGSVTATQAVPTAALARPTRGRPAPTARGRRPSGPKAKNPKHERALKRRLMK